MSDPSSEIDKVRLSPDEGEKLETALKRGTAWLEEQWSRAIDGQIWLSRGYETFTDWFLGADMHQYRLAPAIRRWAVERLALDRPDMSQRAIGRAVGVDHKTVASALGKFPSAEVSDDGKPVIEGVVSSTPPGTTEGQHQGETVNTPLPTKQHGPLEPTVPRDPGWVGNFKSHLAAVNRLAETLRTDNYTDATRATIQHLCEEFTVALTSISAYVGDPPQGTDPDAPTLADRVAHLISWHRINVDTTPSFKLKPIFSDLVLSPDIWTDEELHQAAVNLKASGWAFNDSGMRMQLNDLRGIKPQKANGKSSIVKPVTGQEVYVDHSF